MKKFSRWRLIQYLAASLIVYLHPALAAAQQPIIEQEMLLAVVVNDKPIVDGARVLRSEGSGILVPLPVLEQARLKLPGEPSIRIGDEDYYFIDALPGIEAQIEANTQTLSIRAAATAFISANLNLRNHGRLLEQSSETGAFLNYDINYVDGSQQRTLSGLTEIGVFTAGGTFTSRFVTQNLIDDGAVFRLDSQYVRDFPAQQATLVVGDSVTGASSLSRQVYFGGIQWRTNFSTTPGYEAIPLPAFSGTALAPSVVDIYVNNVLRLRQPVDTGPFSIQNLPVSTGQGNMQMVVRDVLGRQQIFTQSYITSAQLLRPGTKDVSFEVGALRNNFGRRDSDYGQLFTSGTLRYGLRESATVEGHAEVMQGREQLGLGAAVAIADVGLLSGGLAASQSEQGTGTAQYVQFDRQGDQYALTLRAQTAAAQFWQLGWSKRFQTPAKQIQAQANFSIGARTSVAIGYLSQVNRRFENVRGLNAGFNVNLHRYGNISVGVLKSLTGRRSLAGNIVWVIPLERQSVLQMMANAQRGSKSVSTEYQKTSPPEGGWGFRARKSALDNSGEDVGVNYLGTYGEYAFNANHAGSTSNVQLATRGGVALLGGHVRPTRWLDESFAMVEVPVSDPIDIYANNIKVGQTNEQGVGFIPRLIPYESNNVYLDATGLPLSMTLDLAPRSVIPGPRTGSLLKFDAQRDESATLILEDVSGMPLPAGTRVYVGSDPQAYEVALRGHVFIAKMDYPVRIVVQAAMPDSSTICRVDVASPQSNEPFPTLGPFTCGEVHK